MFIREKRERFRRAHHHCTFIQNMDSSTGKQQQAASSGEAPRFREFGDLMNSYDPSTNKTSPILTRYEKSKLLGLRTEQISRGAKPLIDVTDSIYTGLSPANIALEELRQKKTPMVVVRNLPDGKREYWRIRDMAILFQT